MKKTIFEEMDGTYTMQRDYRLPNLTLPPEEERPISVWGQRHRRYLQRHHKILYYNLLAFGNLRSHLSNVEEEAQSLFLRLVKQMADAEGITETLKANDQMEWVGRMNNVRSRAFEIVEADIIYT